MICGTILDKSVLVGVLGPTGGAPGSRKAPDPKSTKDETNKYEMVDPPGPEVEGFPMIFVKSGC